MSFTVICNSGVNAGGTNASNYQYSFDFSKFDDGPYKLTFEFVSQATNANNIYFIIIPDFGTCLNSYTAGGGTNAQLNNFLGIVSNWNGASVGTGYLTNLQQMPKFIANRPRCSTFTVNIADTAGTAIAAPVQYVLILNFEKV